MQSHYVKVLLNCIRHRQSLNLCVRVRRGVPHELRCQPGGSVSGGFGSPLCEDCQDLLRGQRLEEIVNDLTRRGWSEHVNAGAVVVGC